MIWKPNVTVAAILERDGKFLLVEEESATGLVLNQPAGHLESGENLLDAAVRETLEESAYRFEPQHLIGIYRWHSDVSHTTYLRFAFTGKILTHYPDQPLDTGIVRAVWMTLDEIRESQTRHRSPLVLRCVEDCLAGKRFPLDLLVHYS
ncbi:MAG: NUDIX hydrolase [Candidatus Nitrotoga sp.]